MTARAVLLGVLAASWAAWTLSAGTSGPHRGGELAALWLVGVALMLVGLLARGQGIGLLAAATGFAWLIPLLRFSDESVPWTLSLVGAGAYFGPLVHLVFVYPGGRRPDRREHALVIAAYLVTLAGSAAIALFARDPGSLGYEGFPRNLVLVNPNVSIWEALSTGQAVVQAALATTLLVLLVLRVRSAPRGALVAAVAGLAAALLLALPLVDAGLTARSVPWLQTPWDWLRWLAIGAFAAAPVALCAGLLRARLARSGMAGLVLDLDRSTSSDSLHGALIRTLRDPSLSLAIWDADLQRFADLDGRPVELPTSGSGRAATMLERRGRRVGALLHDVALLEDPELIEAAASAVRIALENERLHEELRTQLREVHASRTRIVEAGDRERRRLERNLHDGAQQKLVSLSLALRLAERRARDDPSLHEALQHAVDLTRDALADMRALAHGLHPPILREEGLAGAFEALAGAVPIPVEVVEAPDERLPEPVEIAAYFMASEALTNVVKYAAASRATLSAVRDDGRLVIEVADDGRGGADPSRGSGLRGVADRLAAIDGWMKIESPPAGGTRLRAEIPCA